MFLALELCLTAICMALAFTIPELGHTWFTSLERRLATFARKPALALVSVGLLALGLRLAILPILPIPQPEVHDEYSYLLLADTLAHGRLANPTCPMWVHFETFHVNWYPTYASMYYPGHSLFLAFGQVVLGHPFWGVWLSSGLMCVAICWALQGWMPSSWALLGGLLAVIRLGTFSYWADSYWGGTVPAIGGALVLGALPRIKQHQRIGDSVLLALGMAVLASSRPYEGLFFCSPVIIALVGRTLRKGRPRLRTSLLQVAMPAGLVMTLAFAGMGYYFWRVTGSPFITPYQLNIRTYGLIYFPWQKIRPITEFHHDVMRMFYRGDAVVGVYDFARHHPLKLQIFKQLVVWLFYFGPLLTMPWLVCLFTRPRGEFRKCFSPKFRFLLLIWLVTSVSLMLTIYVGQPHYSSPLTVVFYATSLLVMRDLYGWQLHGRPSGQFLVRSVPLICVVLFLLRSAAPVFHMEPKPSWVRTWCSQDAQNLERARVLKQLESTPGSHLVLVRYRPDHDFILNEWVFNNADINGSKVVWARDMGAQNAELLQYFDQRKAWLLEPDYNPPRLSLYAQ